jgi:hypothetical protein
MAKVMPGRCQMRRLEPRKGVQPSVLPLGYTTHIACCGESQNGGK